MRSKIRWSGGGQDQAWAERLEVPRPNMCSGEDCSLPWAPQRVGLAKTAAVGSQVWGPLGRSSCGEYSLVVLTHRVLGPGHFPGRDKLWWAQVGGGLARPRPWPTAYISGSFAPARTWGHPSPV